MEGLKKLQALILKIIISLIWLDLAYFAMMLAGMAFKWAFLGSSFYSLFGMSFGILGVLALLHLVLTMNIISRSVEALARGKSTGSLEGVDSKSGTKNFGRWMIVAIGGILIFVVCAGVAEHYGIKQKNIKTQEKLGEAARSSLTDQIVNLIDQDAMVSKLYFVRDELLLSMGSQKGVTLLVPKQGSERQVFYQITPWDSQFPWHHAMDVKEETKEDVLISKSLKSLFSPRREEEKEFNQMLKDQKPFSVAGEYQSRAFWPIVRNGQIKLILLSDAAINISDDVLYSRGSQFRKTA